MPEKIDGFTTWPNKRELHMHVRGLNNKVVSCMFFGVSLVLLFTSLAARTLADAPFSSRPMFWQPVRASDRQIDQTFNGLFVARLLATFAAPSGEECLRQAGSTEISIITYDNGLLRASAASTVACKAFSQTAKLPVVGNQTENISIPASHILSVKRAVDMFNSVPAFSRNDRDLKKYDVESYEKAAKIYVSLLAPPYSNPNTLGCPQSGLLSLTYVIDPGSMQVTGGNMAC